nr:hypothetical protein [Tanacetum cinerariifolium]
VTAAASQCSAPSATIYDVSATIPAVSATIPAAVLTVVAAYTRRRKGVTIRDPEEDLPLETLAKTPKSREEMEAEDQEIIKSINKTPTQKAAKRRKLSEEAQEAKDLRKRLEVVILLLQASFTTLRKNFDREDLETLWRIVKDRFSTSKPSNFSDEYLLLTLRTMFEEPDRQDAIWRNQKSVHGLALVKR